MQTQDNLKEKLNLITSFIPYFIELIETDIDCYYEVRFGSYYIKYQKNIASLYNSTNRLLSFSSGAMKLLSVNMDKTIHIESNAINLYKMSGIITAELCDDVDKDSTFNYILKNSNVLDDQEMQIALHFSENKIQEPQILLIDDIVELDLALKELKLYGK